MAKSIRSKWARKMRKIKRVRYGEKELARLKGILQNADDENMSEIFTVIPHTALIRKQKDNSVPDAAATTLNVMPHTDLVKEQEDNLILDATLESQKDNPAPEDAATTSSSIENMVVDSVPESKLDSKTLKDNKAIYPEWMNQRAIRKKNFRKRLREKRIKGRRQFMKKRH